MPRKRQNPDGRASNGGARQGTPGQRYPNRSDLQQAKVFTPPSSEYGQGERLKAAQRAVPMAGAPAAPTPAGAAGPAPGNPLAGLIQASATPTLGQPSARPGEPLTAGMSFGPGRTPAPGQGGKDYVRDEMEDRLRALFQHYPTRELRELLEQYE